MISFTIPGKVRLKKMKTKCFILIAVFSIILSLCNSKPLLSSSHAKKPNNKKENPNDEIWKLRKIDSSKFPRAKCLDGSQPAFYYRLGRGDGSNKFYIHHQSGGWCTDLNDCYNRSNMYMGSTEDKKHNPMRTNEDPKYCIDTFTAKDGKKTVQPCFPDGNRGLMSADHTNNAISHNWNTVYIRYCDGGSYAGNVDEPVTVTPRGKPPQRVFFRGKAILDSVYETLLKEFSMNKATEVIIAGTSAGGLSIFLHLDYLKEKILKSSTLPSSSAPPRVVGICDGGYFVDYPSIKGTYSYTPHFKNVFYMQNMTTTVNQKCIKHYSSLSITGISLKGHHEESTEHSRRNTAIKQQELAYSTDKDQTWKCFMAEYLLPFIETDLFLVNSLIDSWQGSFVMGLSRVITQDCFYRETDGEKSCPDNVKTYLQQFRDNEISKNSPLHHYLSQNKKDSASLASSPVSSISNRGAWLVNCWSHGMLNSDHWWNEIKVNGYTMKDVFYSWYRKDTNPKGVPWVIIDEASNGREFQQCT
jgi:predicted RNase H-like HicB family nuclease